MKYKDIKENKEVQALIAKACSNLGVLGLSDHSLSHLNQVVKGSSMILKSLGYKKKLVENVRIAAFMHDIGYAINGDRHAEYGALLANDILKETDLDRQDRISIVSAIAHHDESTGGAIDAISASLIIADKSDLRRKRVLQIAKNNIDANLDKLNYAVTKSELSLDKNKKQISLNLKIDEKICTTDDYFDMFSGKLIMCRKASEILGVTFNLVVNGNNAL